MATIDQYETSRSGNRSRNQGRFVGERIFSIPRTAMASMESQYTPSASNTWPDTVSGILTPVLEDYHILNMDPAREGYSEVRCLYKSPDFAYPTGSQPLTGKLEMLISGKREKRNLEKAATGTAKEAEGVIIKVVRGDAHVFQPLVTWKMAGMAISSYDPTDLAQFVGTVNANDIFQGRGTEGTVLFMGGRAIKPMGASGSGAMWNLGLVFVQTPNLEWNDSVQLQEWFKKVIRKKVYLNGAEVSGVFRDVVIDYPYSDTLTSPDPVLFPLANFSVFDDALDW